MQRLARYVFVVTALAPGGTLSVMREFWSRLDGVAPIQVISYGPDSAATSHPVRTTRGRYGGPLRFPAIWIYFARTLLACAAEVRRPGRAILLPQDSLATGAAAAIVGRLNGTPVVLMEHGTAAAIASEYFWTTRLQMRRRRDRLTLPLLRASVRLLHRVCLALVTRALVAGDESERRLVEAGLDPARIRRYHFPVDLDRFHPVADDERAAIRRRLGLDPARPVVASVSRLATEKGVDAIVEAVASLGAKPRPILVVAGDGPERQRIGELARSRDVETVFLGAMEPDGVADVLRATDLFVYAGRQGANTPYAVLEAMASGVATIATTAPAVHAEMLGEGRGVAIAVDDVDALRGALRRLIADAETRHEMGRRARAYVERHHAPSVLDRELRAALAGLP